MKINLAAETLGHIGSLTITNTFWVVFAVSIILIIIFWRASRSLQTIPKGIQFWSEVILEMLFGVMNDITGSESLTRQYFPFIATLFLFFVTANLLSLVPGLGAITFNGEPFYRAATSDYNVILSITLISFLVMQLAGIRAGALQYLKKFINFSSPINFLVGLLELIGEFARILSLSFRFFGNLFAEETLLIVILGLEPFLVPLPFQILGIATAIIQPVVFMFIVLIFISLNSSPHEAQ